jgi:hypothetical protein
MKKKKDRHFLAKLFTIKPWYLLMLTLLSLAVCIYALRANNEHMLKLRTAVYSADQDNGDVTTALENLQHYVTSHMNTDLSSGSNSVYPPIQLANTYKRLVDAQSQLASGDNSQLYTDAENYCQTQVPNGFSGRYRIPCIEQYITSHSLQQVSIDQSLYQFDFISPSWSPDLAGWSLLCTIFLGILYIASLVGKWHYKKLS